MTRKTSKDQPNSVKISSTGAPFFLIITFSIACSFYPLFTSKDGVFGFQFIHWDDDRNFVSNPYWKGLSFQNLMWSVSSNHIDVWEPLSWLLKQLQYELFGESSAALHIITLLFHIINSILLFNFTESFFRTIHVSDTSVGSLFAILWYGIHPLRCEVVGWASGQSYAVACLFSLLSASYYLDYLQSKHTAHSKIMLSIICYGFAVLSKTSAISVSFALLILETFVEVYSTPTEKKNVWTSFKKAMKNQTGFMLLFVVFLSISFASSGTHLTKIHEQSAQLDFSQKILRATFALCFYLNKLMWPTQLAPMYPALHDVPISLWEDQFYFPLGVVGIISAMALMTVNHMPSVSAIWFSYIALSLPLLGFAHMHPLTLAFDRYTYSSVIPFHILVAAGITWILHQLEIRKYSAHVAYFGIVTLLSLSAFMTSQQLEKWRTTESLFVHTLRVIPGEPIATTNLGTFYMDQKRFKEACTVFDKVSCDLLDSS